MQIKSQSSNPFRELLVPSVFISRYRAFSALSLTCKRRRDQDRRNNMWNAIRLIFGKRRLLFETVLLALKARFVGNALGAAWVILYPGIFLALYATVMIQILGVRTPGLSTSNYVLVIFSGLVPFLAFSESLGVGTAAIVANRSLLRNTLFPIELVVMRDVLVGHVTMGIGMLLVCVAAWYNGHLHGTQLLLPLVYGLQIVMALGLVWLTATLNVFFRDLQQTIPIIVLMLMMVSPIAYTPEMVPAGLKFLTVVNPLAWLMDVYRGCLIFGEVPWDKLFLLMVFSAAIFSLGLRVITRLKPVFVDYV